MSVLDRPKSSQTSCVDDAKFLIELHLSTEPQKSTLLGLLAKVNEDGTVAERWDRINRAQQAIATCLPVTAVPEHFRSWLRQAQELKIAGIADFEAMASAGFFDNGGVPLDKRDVLLSLVQATQAAYRERRMSRELRNTTARALVARGIALAFVAMAFMVLAHMSPEIQDRPSEAAERTLVSSSIVFTLGSVVSFGLLGAFFSRLIQFQRTTLFTLSDYIVTFQLGVMWVRLVVGAIGAVIFYLALRGQLIAGTAMPDLSKLSGFDVRAEPVAPLSVVTVHTELAKLMIWSFIAGFSERLVPDSLSSIEARANKSQDEPKPPATPPPAAK